MKKKLIIRIVAGFIVGSFVGNLITFLVNLGYGEGLSIVSPHQIEAIGLVLAIVLQSLFSGLLGVVSIGGICFYDIESWSLLKATIAHSVSVMIGFIIVFMVLQWVPFTLVSCLVIAASVLIIYALIWLIMYLIWKKEVEKMNKDLEIYQARESKE
ncbi:MAG TPA: DUF3021 domain-containing protein [Bacilli bacterium]|nr:MAG: hypothetical protein BWY97_01343 [Tenericutes bacterium ADurb.BinA124]HPN61299.1 DUF3021 domain-containing protein [Bacilli bacterium]HPX84449.1 DUF3021 domain-containing protein [Bacilli bacterium]